MSQLEDRARLGIHDADLALVSERQAFLGDLTLAEQFVADATHDVVTLLPAVDVQDMVEEEPIDCRAPDVSPGLAQDPAAAT